MSFGLIGACLFELVDYDRIAIKDNRLKVNNHKPVGDPVLEKLSHARKKKVKSLIKEGVISSSVSQSVQEWQAAIMAGVVDSTAASTAAAESN